MAVTGRLRARPGARRVTAWVLVLGGGALLGGPLGVAIALAVCLYDLLAAPTARQVLGLAVAVAALVPLVLLLRLPAPGVIGPSFAGGPVPNALTGAALMLLVLGTVRDQPPSTGGADPAGDGPRPEPEDGAPPG